MSDAEVLARTFHEAYERLAPTFTYQTRDASAVPWDQVPTNNKALMIATAQAVIDAGYEPPEPDSEPCDAEIHSWSYFKPLQIDSYWIRCTLTGPHDEHEDSNTGATWKD